MEKREALMREIWRLNALRAGLHEPVCLLKDCLERADGLGRDIQQIEEGSEKRFYLRELEAVSASLRDAAAFLSALAEKLERGAR